MKQAKSWEDDFKIYLKEKKKIVFEKAEEKGRLFDIMRDENDINLIENHIGQLFICLETKYKEANPEKDDYYIEIIFNIYLKEKYKACNPNTCSEYIEKMYDYLENFFEYCIDYIPNDEEIYCILENFLINR